MKVSDILRVKGGTLYTVDAQEPLYLAVQTMAEKDMRFIGRHRAR
jgi:hypothetical protein